MHPRALLLPLLLTATLTGCAGPARPTTGPAASRPPGSTPWLVSGAPSPQRPSSAPTPGAAAPLAEGTVSGTFLPFPQSARAVTYDPQVVPPGATALVDIARTARGTTVRLTARGLVPRRAYGAHLHTRPCTSIPDDAGPHYQHSADPRKPSVDPAYANPRNEVWLDFTADAAGAATVTARLDWTFDEVEPPRSLIVHAEHTRTAAGKAGMAGPRVACLTLGPR
ncbi:superoxide dismutase [Actinoplanes sp. NPDC049599]|uniref:superoxide dismutase n=1 Tax=Actinoplanes sp. NPDC049599 TaxID=3363903 RepID=UPI00379931A6